MGALQSSKPSPAAGCLLQPVRALPTSAQTPPCPRHKDHAPFPPSPSELWFSTRLHTGAPWGIQTPPTPGPHPQQCWLSWSGQPLGIRPFQGSPTLPSLAAGWALQRPIEPTV